MGLNAPKLKKIMIKKESFILGGVQNWFSQHFKREHLQKCLFLEEMNPVFHGCGILGEGRRAAWGGPWEVPGLRGAISSPILSKNGSNSSLVWLHWH